VEQVPTQSLAPPPNPKLPGTRRPSPHPDSQSPRASRRPVSTPPTPSKPTPPGTRRPSPHPDANCFGGGDLSSPHPRPRNARHQFETSPALSQPVFKTLKGRRTGRRRCRRISALSQPVFKTLKGFQTVAGGKAVRPPPPVPRPQNSSPLRLRRGLGVVASQNLRKPSVPIHRDALRYHGDETNLTEGASLGAESVRAEPQPGHRPVLRLSACSAGLHFLPRSLKAELRRTEPRKDALRVTQQRRDRGFRGFRG